MKARRLILLNIITVLVLAVLVIGGWYWYNQSVKYLSTDNAAIAGQEFAIAAPASGQLQNWKGDVGQQFSAGQAVASIALPPAAPGRAGAVVNVTTPSDGTVVQSSAVNNQVVAAGTPLAYAFNMKNLWVTANIKETDINDVKVGQTVDVYVDAFPGTTLTGTVNQIGLATANTFSLMPQSNASGNYTKVTQVVPVKITLSGSQGINIVPGMSVTVRIHK